MNRTIKTVLVSLTLFIIVIILFSIAPAIILGSIGSNINGPLWRGITCDLEPTDVYLRNITTINYTILSNSRELEWYALNITYNGNSIFYKNITTNSEGGSIVTSVDPSNKTGNINVITYFKRKGQDLFYSSRAYIIWRLY